MKHRCFIVSLFAALWSCATSAGAQPPTPAPQPVAYPRWDAGGSYGLVNENDDESIHAFGSHDFGSQAWTLDIGRYVSTHWKIDAAVMTARSHREFDFPTHGFIGYTTTTVQPIGVSAAGTYQFFENKFMHPYVSAGVHTIRLATHVEREGQTVTVNRVNYTVTPIDERSTTIIARPFVSFGCKSYFNSRVFMRSEASLALGSHGYSHTTLRIGTGFDF